MPRNADIPQQDEAVAPPERGSFYPGLLHVPATALLGEVIDIRGFRGPLVSQFTGPEGQERSYIVFRARVHGPLDLGKDVDPDDRAAAKALKCGDEITAATSAARIIEKLQRVGRKDPASADEAAETLSRPVRGQMVQVKTDRGFFVRDLVAAPGDWTCPTCGAQAPSQ